MAFVKRVDSIDEALALASEGKSSGKWDLFRGHTNAEWRVTSSAERLPVEKQEEAFERFVRFHDWTKAESSMRDYFKDRDSLLAIAQHYGIPTQYIDFTNDPYVAAFFACDMSGEPVAQQEAAVICLDSKEFKEFWEICWPIMTKGAEDVAPPELIQIDVHNLWRLQKQRGHFLWNPVIDIEMHFNFDRIIFPYVKDHASVPRGTDIYPPDQSELEKKLSQFFMNEAMHEGNRHMEEMAKQGLVHVVRWNVDSYEFASWSTISHTPDKDWENSQLWQPDLREHADDVFPGARVSIAANASFEGATEIILKVLSPAFVERNRGRAIHFATEDSAAAFKHHPELLARVRRLWNGMRTLPYTPEEIAASLAHSLSLLPIALQDIHVRQAFGLEGIYVEMATTMDGPGPYSRGAVTFAALKEASHPTFLKAAELRLGMDLAAQAKDFTRLPGRPWERFTFRGLRKLMVEQLIPTQVAWRAREDGDDALRTVIYFSPTDFKIFGLA